MLVVNAQNGSSITVLLVGSKGEMLNEKMLPHIARTVRVSGRLQRYHDRLFDRPAVQPEPHGAAASQAVMRIGDQHFDARRLGARIGELGDQRVLGGEDHERRPEERVGAGGEDGDRTCFGKSRKIWCNRE